jgi:hypothetical protein
MRPEFPLGFYVYRLVDPRNGLPFYVGKGQRGRAWEHEQEVRRGLPGCNDRKRQKIADIIRSGLEVEIEIIASYEDEADALDHEWRLVDAMPTLTNMAPGGGGRIETPFLRQRRQELLSRRIAERRKRQLEAARRRDGERKEQRVLREKDRLLSVPGADERREEIEAWFATTLNPVPEQPERPYRKGGLRGSRKRKKRNRARAKRYALAREAAAAS